jgi:GntR family transcriptional repressor for pyruvate dehydrogenase complex
MSENVAREIVRDTRGLPSGSVLPGEAAMVEKYGAGRASVREALRLLEAQGVVVVRPGPGGGPVLLGPDSRHFARMTSLYLHRARTTYRNLVDARLVMEPVMARLAAERHDATVVAEMTPFAGEAPDPLDHDGYFDHATGFHAVIAALSNNRVLDLIGLSLQDLFAGRLEGVVFPVEARARVQDEHRCIASAIISGDAARAERLMRTHMQEFADLCALRHPGILDEIVGWR